MLKTYDERCIKVHTYLSQEKWACNIWWQQQSTILGVGKIGINSSNSIENVLLVEGLKHNLLSVSQLCDKGYLVSFDSQKCLIEHKHDTNIKHVGYRVNHVYMIDVSLKLDHNHCFLSKDDDPWLWHKLIAHINMEHLNKLISKDLVVG